MSKTLRSSITGLESPTGRNDFFKTGYGFLEGRRKDDGAEGLWRIKNKLYDLESFVKNHPGGEEWLILTRGTDITEAFESHHVTLRPEKMLSKFFIRDATSPRPIPFSLEPNGFYIKFKNRAREVLKNVDIHNPSTRSKLYADFIVTVAILAAIGAARFKSWIFVIVSGIFLSWTAIAAHNFFHMKDNFRMYYFDLSMMSSKEWRISHVLSHHMYPNTLWDMEIYAVEPFLPFLPSSSKTIIHQLRILISIPIFWAVAFLGQGVKRYLSLFLQWKKVEFRDVLPFFFPIVMCLFASSVSEAVIFWLAVNICSSFVFNLIGFTAAHHHPRIFHDGDHYRTDDLDWGLLEIDAVRDRTNIDNSLFFILTNFGDHALHHLLPTIDHAYLSLCLPAFLQTCEEFGVDNQKTNSWELMKGCIEQLMRRKALKNYRGAKTD